VDQPEPRAVRPDLLPGEGHTLRVVTPTRFPGGRTQGKSLVPRGGGRSVASGPRCAPVDQPSLFLRSSAAGESPCERSPQTCLPAGPTPPGSGRLSANWAGSARESASGSPATWKGRLS